MTQDNWFWRREEDEKLKFAYRQKLSKKDTLASLPDRTYGAIKHRAKKLKIKKTRLQYKNEAFFGNPNQMNSSVAGFLASDGNIQLPKGRRGFRIIVGLSRKDESFLESIRDATGSNVAITRSQQLRAIITDRNPNAPLKTYLKSTSVFSGSEKWIGDLSKHWNITPNKTLTLLPPPNLNELDIKLAYIVGLINGDGTIGIQKTNGKNYLYIRLLGTKALLDWAVETFTEAIGETFRGVVVPERKGANVFRFQVNGVQASKLFKKMKNLNCLRLNRKWDNPKVLEVLD